MSSSEVDSRSITLSMRKSVENLVISSQDAIGQSISQALNFSGVISQHANQIIQETRSVSRSPSPSPRHTDAGPESLDNDKCSETSLVVPSGGSGDSASVSSASELATVVGSLPSRDSKCSETSLVVPSGGSGDSASVSSASELATVVGSLPSRDSKVTSATPPRGAEGASRAKKKSWYTALYPTYKNKSDDFKRLFKDLPDDERLIVDYSCALQKDILVHGRLYASQNYLCFHASIFSWETSLALRWKDVTAITKEKTALVIPNAILVCAAGEKNFLTSFSGRDKAYLMLFRVWQNALMDQPMTSQEIWQWVHSCYGEELGFNSDDEGYGRDFPEESSLPPDAAEDLVESMEATGGGADEGRGARGQAPSARDSDPPLVTTNGDAAYREEEGGDTLPTDMSDTSDSDDKPHNGGEEDACTASHEGQRLLQQEVPFNIDQLFTMMFTNSKFNLELLAARGTTDYVQAPWQVQSGLKCRQISYTLGLTSGPIGPKEVHVTETQVMNKCSKPGVMYSIDACSENSGIPYADYFSVRVHYCLARIADSRTSLAVIARLHYKKTMWNTIKGFLEKNTISGLEAFCRLLAARLHAEADAAPAARKRRHRRNTVSAQETAVAAPLKLPVAAGILSPRAPPRGAPSRWLLGCVLLLLLINALLYWRLHQAIHSQPSDKLVHELGKSQAAQWGALLQAHAARQRGELRAWRTALDDTRNHLHQTEQALMKLLETIKPSLEGAPPDAQPSEEPPPPTPRPDL